MNKVSFTICTVSFNSGSLLELNYRLTKYLNPHMTGLNWVVVENTPRDGSYRVPLKDDRFTVIEGVEAPKMEKYRGSYHHAAGLNKAIGHVNTRFVLILDPDFFIVKKDWIKEVLDYMSANGLAFFGAPWHPRWYMKYRYFPCVHCMFIDLEKVNLKEIDFSPDLLNNPAPYRSKLMREHEIRVKQGNKIRAWLYLLKHLRQVLAEDLQQRQLIGSSRDTGYHIYEEHSNKKNIRYDMVMPVYQPRVDSFVPPHVTKLQSSRFLEFFMPDRLKYIPRKKNYFTKTGFKESGLVSLACYDWEEFMWNRKPFGFHIRGFLQQKRGSQVDVATVAQVLRKVAGITVCEDTAV
ncbi:MAG: hypothetical protein AB1374_00145 [Bacillota bacterium]